MMCERCVVNQATVFVIRNPWESWAIECPWCGGQTVEYYVPIDGFMRSTKSALGWLQHLSAKSWYRPGPFVDALLRYGCEAKAAPEN